MHFEKGIFYTIKELLLRPGKTIRDFLTETRTRIVKPIIFIIVTSLAFTFITNYFHIEESYINIGAGPDSFVSAMNQWLRSHYGYANILVGVFIAIWIKVFFKKFDYNLYEILILLFIMGMFMLLGLLFAILQAFTDFQFLRIGGYIGIIYCCWGIADFFGSGKILNYIKALLSYYLGFFSFAAVVLIIGLLLDSILKH